MPDFLSFINEILWGSVMIYLLLGAGIWFSWFLRLDKPRYIWGLRILTVLMVLLGTMVSLPVVWQSADIIMALMAMTNLTAILLLSPTVRIIASDYLRQRRLGIQPTFDATRYPDIDQQLAPGAWNELPRE